MVKVCNCAQCRAAKKKRRTTVRKFFKRYSSKLRRKLKEGEVKNLYWA